MASKEQINKRGSKKEDMTEHPSRYDQTFSSGCFHFVLYRFIPGTWFYISSRCKIIHECEHSILKNKCKDTLQSWFLMWALAIEASLSYSRCRFPSFPSLNWVQLQQNKFAVMFPKGALHRDPTRTETLAWQASSSWAFHPSSRQHWRDTIVELMVLRATHFQQNGCTRPC